MSTTSDFTDAPADAPRSPPVAAVPEGEHGLCDSICDPVPGGNATSGTTVIPSLDDPLNGKCQCKDPNSTEPLMPSCPCPCDLRPLEEALCNSTGDINRECSRKIVGSIWMTPYTIVEVRH